MSLFDQVPAGIRHRVKTPDGVEIEAREWGAPAGPELLLVTGVAQSYLSFARQYADPAFGHFRVVAYDPRGHGLSDKPFGDTWYREGRRWSDEVTAVMDAVGLARPVLAGWSLGGRIVRQYLVDYGDSRLAGLGLISCRPVEVPEVVGQGNDVVRALDIEDGASRIAVAAAFLRNCFKIQPATDDFAFMLAYNMLCSWPIRRQIGGWLTDPAVSTAALKAVRVPTYIAHGLADVLVLPGASKISERLIPHAEVSWYADCGHSVFFEAAPRFNREFAAFVQRASATLAAAGGRAWVG
jgi:pimeloyl-ACP methyl ester carboxylesterase